MRYMYLLFKFSWVIPGYSGVAQWWSKKLLTSRLPVRVRPPEPRKIASLYDWRFFLDIADVGLNWRFDNGLAIIFIAKRLYDKPKINNYLGVKLYSGLPSQAVTAKPEL